MKTQKITSYIENHQKRILWLAIFLFCIVVISLLAVKFFNYGYNAIDLGIYNQIFYNSTQGELFQFSIHPHSYLGDHFELFILILLPFYYIWQSSFMLLILQTVFIGLSAWPLYLIAKRKLSPTWSLIITVALLLNPFILNMNFFEFHILPFAIFLLLFTFYFYAQKKFFCFMVFSCLALLVREDVPLVIFMFGILALIEKRKWSWYLMPIIISTAWFIGAIYMTGYLNQSGSYKFLSMYGWLGGSIQEMLINIFTQPWLVIKQIFSLNNFFLVIGSCLPLAGLPFLKLKYLIPACLVFIQLLLIQTSSVIVLQTHYLSLIIPFLFIAAIYALEELNRKKQPASLIKQFILKRRLLFSTIFIAAVIYSFLTFSPIIPGIIGLFNKPKISYNTTQYEKIINNTNKNEAIVASFRFLPYISNRPHLYSLHYSFQGKKQFSEEPYEIPVDIDKIAIDFDDFLIYHLQSQNISSYKENYSTGPDRIHDLISQNNLNLSDINDSIAVYEKNADNKIVLYEIMDQPDHAINGSEAALGDAITYLGWRFINDQATKNDSLAISLFWQAQKKLADNYQIKFQAEDKNGEVIFAKYYPLGYGLLPTSHWPPDKIIKTNYWFTVPNEIQPQISQLNLRLVDIKGYMGLDGIRSAVMDITEEKIIGPDIPLPYNTL
ncbi:DUF2079 domain-containing protein [Patescibacteria group bacterium]|nr:DUF2079 domain-containing protein [Patescibacteria group bacterium]